MTHIIHNIFDCAGIGVLTWFITALVLSHFITGYADEFEEDLDTVKLCALIAAATASLVAALNLNWS